MSLEGQQLGRYRIVRLLKNGGMGDVYLAEDANIQQQVAIKVIRTDNEPGSDLDVVKDGFQREARAIVKLDHPHILPLFDYGEEYVKKTLILYLVMPYRPEGSLSDWIHRITPSRLTPQSVAHIILQAGNALQHAHDRQIIHQDVKPSNFLLRFLGENPEQPDILLTDFGIAKFIATTTYMSRSISGTPSYMSPEQSMGYPVPASDQYSLAIMAYELLANRLPFHGNIMHVMYQHRTHMPEPLSAYTPGLPQEIDFVLAKALSKRPEERFPSVSSFATTLHQALKLNETPTFIISPIQGDDFHPTISEKQIATSTPSPSQNSNGETAKVQEASTQQKWLVPLPRRKTLILLMTTGAVLALSSTIIPLVNSRNSKSQPTPTNSFTSDTVSPIYTSKPLIISSAHPATVTSLSWSADGKYIASAGFDGTIRTWDTSRILPALYIYTTQTDKSMWTVAWSPNREWLVSGCADDSAYIWDAINGGRARLLYKGHTDAVNAVQWATDSVHIVSGSADGTVRVWEGVSGTTLAIHRGFSLPVTGVAWSPDNKHIVAGSRDKTARVWSALGDQTPLCYYRGHTDHINSVAWSPNGMFIASGSDDNTVQVWDATTGGHVYTYSGHTDHVNPVAWSPDSKQIASGSWDTTVHVWNALNGNNVYIYKGHTNHVNAVVWSPDGKFIASAGVDQTIQIWQIPH